MPSVKVSPNDAIAVPQPKDVRQDHLAHVVTQETKDPMDQMEKMAHLVFLESPPDPSSKFPPPASTAHQDHLDHRDPTESPESLVHLDMSGPKADQEDPAHQDQLASQESQGHQDQKVAPVSQDPQAAMASAERDQRDQRALLAHVDHLESQARMARGVQTESQETRVPMEDLDAMDAPARTVALDRLAALDYPVRMHTTARARLAAAYSSSRSIKKCAQLILHDGLPTSTDHSSTQTFCESLCFSRKNKRFMAHTFEQFPNPYRFLSFRLMHSA